MKTGLLLWVLLASWVVRAQVVPASGRTPASFIPAGYRLLYEGSSRNRADGDLNGDGRPDVVLALTSIKEDTMRYPSSNLPPRLLLVLWCTVTSGYQLAAKAQQLVLHQNSSYMGDPFDGLVIRRGVLIVNYDVGGNRGRSTSAKFRYQQGQFYLVGETNAYATHRPDCDKLSYPPGYSYRDTNYLTGDYEIIRTSDECQLLQHKRGRQPVRPLRKLAEYKPEP